MDKQKQRWEPARLHIQVGDVLTSKKGILMAGCLSDMSQKVSRVKYLGKGTWEVLGDKREFIEIKEVK